MAIARYLVATEHGFCPEPATIGLGGALRDKLTVADLLGS